MHRSRENDVVEMEIHIPTKPEFDFDFRSAVCMLTLCVMCCICNADICSCFCVLSACGGSCCFLCICIGVWCDEGMSLRKFHSVYDHAFDPLSICVLVSLSVSLSCVLYLCLYDDFWTCAYVCASHLYLTVYTFFSIGLLLTVCACARLNGLCMFTTECVCVCVCVCVFIFMCCARVCAISHVLACVSTSVIFLFMRIWATLPLSLFMVFLCMKLHRYQLICDLVDLLLCVLIIIIILS